MKRVAGVTAAVMLSMQMSVMGYGAVTDNASAWAVPHIQEAYTLGLVTDDLLQDAKGAITRQEFCHLLVQFYEKTTGKTAQPVAENPFTDCDDKDVLAAYGLGIVSGIEPNLFYPDNTLTREQMAIMLVRTMEACGLDMLSYAKYNPFADTKNLHANSVKNINKAYGAGLITGYDTQTFAPKKALSVQEAVAMFVGSYRFYETSKKQTETQPTVKPEDTKVEPPKTEPQKQEETQTTQPQKQEQPQTTQNYDIRFGDKAITLGQTAQQIKAVFGEPTRIDQNMMGAERYVYASDWTQYFFVTFEKGVAVELFTTSDDVMFQGVTGGMTFEQLPKAYRMSNTDNCALMEDDAVTVRLPLDDKKVVHGLLIQTAEYAKTEHLAETIDKGLRASLEAEAKDLVQSIRVKQGHNTLRTHEKMDLVARAHSEDMAAKDYFDYNSQDGATPFQRMQAQGLQFHTATEVIVKHRGEIPQLYTELLRAPVKYNTVLDGHVAQMGVGIANRGKTMYLTIDLCN